MPADHAADHRPDRRRRWEQHQAEQSIWFQLAGMAAARGAVIPPDVPLPELSGDTLEAAPA